MRLQAFTSVLALSLIGAGGLSAQPLFEDRVVSAEQMQQSLQGQAELLSRGGWTVVRPADAATAEELDQMVNTMEVVGSAGNTFGVIDQTTPTPTAAATPLAAPAVGEYVRFGTADRVDVSIQFDLNSANIRPEAEPQLVQICQFLSNNATLGLNLAGHTDISGPADYNLQLSAARADSVRTYLISRCGVASQRLYSFGLGETLPLETVAPTDPRNRRVELQIAAVQ